MEDWPRKYQAFMKEQLIEGSSSIDDVIHRNNLKLFECVTKRRASKTKQQLTSLKYDVRLSSWLYISCQTRDGNLEEVFSPQKSGISSMW